MIAEKAPYIVEDVPSLDSPALLVFPDIVKGNIDKARDMVANTRDTLLRPHVKTVKCKEVIHMAMEKGIDRFKCSTIAEAELLAMSGAKDILLCYQLSKAKAQRFNALREGYPSILFSAIVDNQDSALMLSSFFQENPLAVFIDLNVGMDRTGIKPEKAIDLLKGLKDLKGLEIKGFHAYDGHVHAPEIETRKHQTDAIFRTVSALRKKAEGILNKKLTVVIGGSPSFPFYAQREGVECSPGTFFFWDAGYGKSFQELPFFPAAILLTRIISIIDEHTLCLDLGTKATACDPPQPKVDILGLKNFKIIGHYEEHLVVNVPDSSLHQIGEPFLVISHHICTTVNLYEKLIVIEHGTFADSWKVLARDRKITI